MRRRVAPPAASAAGVAGATHVDIERSGVKADLLRPGGGVVEAQVAALVRRRRTEVGGWTAGLVLPETADRDAPIGGDGDGGRGVEDLRVVGHVGRRRVHGGKAEVGEEIDPE